MWMMSLHLHVNLNAAAAAADDDNDVMIKQVKFDLSFERIMMGSMAIILPVTFLAIKPTLVLGIVPKAKKYVFFPIEAKNFPK